MPASTGKYRFTDLMPSTFYEIRATNHLPDGTPSLDGGGENHGSTSTLTATTVSISKIMDASELGPDGNVQDGYFLVTRTEPLTAALTVTVNLGGTAAPSDYSVSNAIGGAAFPNPVAGVGGAGLQYQITIPAGDSFVCICVHPAYDVIATEDAADSVVATLVPASGSAYTIDPYKTSATLMIAEEPTLISLTAMGKASSSPTATTSDGSVPDLYLAGDSNGRAKVTISAVVSPNDTSSRRLTLWTLTADGQNSRAVTKGNFGPLTSEAALPATPDDHDYVLSAGVDLNGDRTLDYTEITRKIKIHVLTADLDVDSDNNNGTGMPDDSKQEEAVDLTAPGKVLALGATALTPVVVDLPAKGTGTGQWRLRVKFGNSKISIYTDSGGNTAATLAADPDSQGEFTTDLQSLPDKAGPTTFYVKGIVASDSPGDIRLSVEIIKPAVSPGSGGSGSSQMTVDHDDALLTVDAATLIIDSNNALGLNDPLGSYTTAQGGMKDTPGLPGKVIQINDKATKDHIPDFADGSNAIPNRDIPDASAPFTPMDIRLSPGIDVSDPSKIIFQLDYSGSDPAAIIIPNPNGDNRQNDPTVYLPAPGMLRIWAKDGTSARHVADIAGNGDYLKPNTTYSWAQLLAQLPAGSKIDDHTVRVYVEGIQTSKLVGDQEIKIRVNPLGGDASPSLGSSGPVLKDALRVTNGFVRVNVDSDNDDGHNVPKVDGVERLIQDDPKLSGKYIALNDGDINNNTTFLISPTRTIPMRLPRSRACSSRSSSPSPIGWTLRTRH
ncbi:MAG: hypothetical protein JWP03_4071 [Phycisphaerales bacterium]|nr:hypothetical protein [Phycisphaerales bacterium]